MFSRPRAFPPLIMLAFATAMWGLDQHVPGILLLNTEWQRAGYALMVVAIGLDLWSLDLFRRSGTTVHPLRLESSRVLVTNGVYRITRNPMYLGLLLLLAGFAIRLGSLTPFLMLPLFVWTLNRSQIVHEERFLAERYGRVYDDYRAKVPRWL